jgi:nickel-dependent lactate racemase
MKIKLAYGSTCLEVDLPENSRIVQAQFVPGVDDEGSALRSALRAPIASSPLAQKVRSGDRVVIVHSDITRPMPNDRVNRESRKLGVSASALLAQLAEDAFKDGKEPQPPAP